MPVPIVPLIAAGASLLGSAASAVSNGNINRKNRDFQEKMWDKNNQYNTPVMQMQRFKEAGLNPHLIYGQGNAGNSSMPSAPVQRPNEYKFEEAAMNYVSARKQQTEVDNMEKAREVMDAQINLSNASASNQIANAAQTTQQREQSAQLFETTVAQAQMNLKNAGLQGQKIGAEISNTNAQTGLTNAQKTKVGQDISESANRIKLMQIEGNNKAIDTELKQLELNLRRQGVNPNDPMWIRILTQQFEKVPQALKWLMSDKKLKLKH